MRSNLLSLCPMLTKFTVEVFRCNDMTEMDASKPIGHAGGPLEVAEVNPVLRYWCGCADE